MRRYQQLIKQRSQERRAFILLVVLIMIALLTLIAAGYTFLVRAELESTQVVVNNAQLRYSAESGIQRAILELRNTNGGGIDNWFDNPAIFRNALVHGVEDTGNSQNQTAFRQSTDMLPYSGKDNQQPANGTVSSGGGPGPSLQPAWRFNLVGPNYDDPSRPRYGLTDECSKLDINRATAAQLRRFFQSAINITSDSNGNLNIDIDVLVDSLMDWREPGNAARPKGAKDDWYLTNKIPGYRCKKGPFDSIDELLLVRGFDATLLYGEDANRNGLLDANEDDGDANFPPDNADGILNRGIAPYLTVWAREYNVDSNNKPRVNINNQDLDTLEKQLTDLGDISAPVKDYIMSRRRLGHGLGDPIDLVAAPPEQEAEEADSSLNDANSSSASQPSEEPGTSGDANSSTSGEKTTLQPSTKGGSSGGGLETTPSESSGSKEGGGTTPEPTQPSSGTKGTGSAGSGTKGGGIRPAQTPSGKSGTKQRQQKTDPSTDTENAGGKSATPSGSTGNSSVGGRQSGSSNQSQGSSGNNFGVRRPGRPSGGQTGGSQSGGSPSSQSSNSSQPSDAPGTLDDLGGILDHLTSRPVPIYVGRINVSTAPKPVLMALTLLTEAQVDQIISVRPTLDSKTRSSPAWLVTQNIISFSKLKALLPSITTKSATYAVESIGYADHLDAFKRLYVILEMRGPVGQILYYRDLTSLGPAYHPRGEDVRGPKNQKSQ